jgi:hypothetical protein
MLIYFILLIYLFPIGLLPRQDVRLPPLPVLPLAEAAAFMDPWTNGSTPTLCPSLPAFSRTWSYVLPHARVHTAHTAHTPMFDVYTNSNLYLPPPGHNRHVQNAVRGRSDVGSLLPFFPFRSAPKISSARGGRVCIAGFGRGVNRCGGRRRQEGAFCLIVIVMIITCC